MRVESAAAAKGKRVIHDLYPRDGTQLRALYDMLMANRGIPINAPLKQLHGERVNQFRNFYGLDLRVLAPGRWVLAGEWFGPTYVDYIADRIKEAERK